MNMQWNDIVDIETDVLSLDVFDTALTRSLEAPVDVFALVERNIEGICGRSARGFALSRELAEQQARTVALEAGREEVSLGEIYIALGKARPDLRSYAAEIQEAELAAERSVIQPVPWIQELARQAVARGTRVIFVSDMYLSGEEIGKFLVACGYDISGGVLVSSDTGCTKASGSQWAILLHMAGEGQRILHVGDNPQSDVESPRHHGIAARLFTGAQSARRPGGPLSPAILPFSRLSRAHWQGIFCPPPPRHSFAESAAETMRHLGASWGVTVVGAFVRWLENRVRNQGIDHLFFCARDGWLPYQVWKVAGCSERTGIPASYLYLSRRAVNLAEAGLDAAGGRLSPCSLERLAGGEMPAKVLLERSGLLTCDNLVSAVCKMFGDLDSPVRWPEGTQKLRRLLAIHQKEVLAALHHFTQAAAGYLHQEICATGRVGMVDIGWHGTLQRSVASLLRLRSRAPLLNGYYYGLWPQAQANRPFTGWMEGCFTNDFYPAADRPGLRNAVAIIENLHSACHGTTIGYKQTDGGWAPILQENSVETVQQAALITPFQEATVAAISEICAGSNGVVAVDALDRTAGLAAIERLALSPTEEELAALGSIQHAVEFDHSRFRRLIPKPVVGQDPPLPWSTDWPCATALQWRAAALKPSVPKEWRNLVITRMRTLGEMYDPRTARLLA